MTINWNDLGKEYYKLKGDQNSPIDETDLTPQQPPTEEILPDIEPPKQQLQEAPQPSPISEEQKLIDEIKLQREKDESEINRARWGDLATNLVKGLTNYSNAQAIARTGIKTDVKPFEMEQTLTEQAKKGKPDRLAQLIELQGQLQKRRQEIARGQLDGAKLKQAEKRLEIDEKKADAYAAQAAKAGQITPFQQAMIEVQNRKLQQTDEKIDQSDTRIKQAEQREERMTDMFKNKKIQQDELSDKQTEQIAELNNIENIANRIKEIKPKVNTGPVASRLKDLSSAALGDTGPGVSQDFIALRQLTGINLADYIKSISAATVTDKERQILIKNIPNMNDDDTTFNTKMKEFEKTLNEVKQTKLANIKKFQGKDVSGKKETPDSQVKAPQSPYGETVNRNGKIYKWNPLAGKYQLAE
jgi:hypothetical protein